MINIPQKIKRGHAFYDTKKNKNVWVYTVRNYSEIVVCDSPDFNLTDTYYNVILSDLKVVSKKTGTSIKQVAKTVSDEEKQYKKDLNTFFDVQALKIPFHCMNCGKPLYASNKFAKRCITCHILPKADFKSIATDPNNIVFMGVGILGGCDCHSIFDNCGAENRSKMKIYDLVLKRFELLKLKLTTKELIKACTYLNLNFQ